MRRAIQWLRHCGGYSALLRVIAVFGFLLVLFYSLRSNYERPEWNFDLVGYVAVIASYSADSPQEVHKRTYDSIRKGVPRGDFDKLASSSGYRKSLYQNPSHLMTQVRLYRNKPGYIAAVYVVHKLGANLARATFIVSLIAYFLLALLLWRWLWRRLGSTWASTLCLCIMLSHPVFLTARMSAPDMLAALFLVPALLALMDHKWKLAAVLLLLSMIIRSDVSLLIAILGSAALLWPPQGLCRKQIAAFCGAALCMHFLLHFLVDPYPHRVLLKHALASRLYMPSQVGDMITWSEYVNGLHKSIFMHGYSLHPTAMWSFALLAAIAILLARKLEKPVTVLLVASCCAYVILHIGLFPIRIDRFFCAHYIFVSLAAIDTAAHALRRLSPKVDSGDVST